MMLHDAVGVQIGSKPATLVHELAERIALACSVRKTGTQPRQVVVTNMVAPRSWPFRHRLYSSMPGAIVNHGGVLWDAQIRELGARHRKGEKLS